MIMCDLWHCVVLHGGEISNQKDVDWVIVIFQDTEACSVHFISFFRGPTVSRQRSNRTAAIYGIVSVSWPLDTLSNSRNSSYLLGIVMFFFYIIHSI
jgi:hypothetical protein